MDTKNCKQPRENNDIISNTLENKFSKTGDTYHTRRHNNKYLFNIISTVTGYII
jgi:hypothetical protein